MLGWTWDEVLQQMDLPRLRTLNRLWAWMPPLPVQLSRIAQALGVPVAGPPSSASREKETPETHQADPEVAEWLASMPTVPSMKIMTPEEFLGSKNV